MVDKTQKRTEKEQRRCGWLSDRPRFVTCRGSDIVHRRVVSVDGEILQDEDVNVQEEIESNREGTEIYSIIDRIKQGYIPVQADGMDYLDQTDLPETDGDALRIAKKARAEFSKLKEKEEREEKVEKGETPQEEKAADVKPAAEAPKEDPYIKLKALLQEVMK